MRILIVTGIFPPDIGGPATYVPQIATALADRGHRITVVTLSDRLGHDDTKYSFQVVRLRRWTLRPWRELLTIMTVMRLGRSADVLFVNGLALEAVLANKVLRKPMVQKVVGDWTWERATNRGWVSDDFEHFQLTRYGLMVEVLKTMRAWWIHRANKVIVPSRYLAKWVGAWGIPEEKIVVIYNAVEPLDGVQPTSVPLNASIKAVTVGRLVPWKRIDEVIKAIVTLTDVGLVVIGEGPQHTYLEKLAIECGLHDRVHFSGQKSKSEASALMAACDLFVLNSTYEGFPHVVLEAMSLGLPVVATQVGGTSEVIQDQTNGLLIASGDDRALSNALKTLSAPARRQCLTEGGKHTVENFSLLRMVKETEAILQNSLQQA